MFVIVKCILNVYVNEIIKEFIATTTRVFNNSNLCKLNDETKDMFWSLLQFCQLINMRYNHFALLFQAAYNFQ